MNFEYFIANRLQSKGKANFSRPIINIAVISIAIGIAVMLVSIAIVTGFQSEIRDKVINFGAHIQIGFFDTNNSLESSSISKKQAFYPAIEKVDGFKHIQVFAHKAGIIKADEQIEGVILKGVGSDFDWSYFDKKIIEGSIFTVCDSSLSRNLIISSFIAKRLRLKVGDKVRMFFVSEQRLLGKEFYLSGIYETGLEEFDKQFIFGDIGQIQKMNQWTTDQIGGFEIFIHDFKRIDELTNYVYHSIDYNLNARNIKQLYPVMFDWLDLLDMNVVVILLITLFVAVINMISALLILILEKINMIGILKALGGKNLSIRKIFLYNATYILARGLFWGNLFALIILLLQSQLGIIKLDPASYYVSHIPVNLSLIYFILINLGVIIVNVIVLFIPSMVITKISPIKAIRFS